jgi:hypothetical protein
MPASVAMKPSIVAMFGRIIPAPLLMPVTVTVRPAMTTRREAALATVSVVMIACAAACQLSARRSATQAGRPAIRRSVGKGSRMTPVEKGNTCRSSIPSNCPRAVQLSTAACQPASPVPAFATPVLMTRARMSLPSSRWRRQICTGAAQKRLAVNTPATRVPALSSRTVRSRRPGLRIAASATPRRTPATGNKAAGEGVL